MHPFVLDVVHQQLVLHGPRLPGIDETQGAEKLKTNFRIGVCTHLQEFFKQRGGTCQSLLRQADGILPDARLAVFQRLFHQGGIQLPQALQCPQSVQTRQRRGILLKQPDQRLNRPGTLTIDQQPLGRSSPPDVGIGQLLDQVFVRGFPQMNLPRQGQRGL